LIPALTEEVLFAFGVSGLLGWIALKVFWHIFIKCFCSLEEELEELLRTLINSEGG